MIVSFIAGAASFGSLPMVLTLGAEIAPNGTGVLAIVWGIALACYLWAVKEREKRDALRRQAAAENAQARAETLLRDGLISELHEAVVVWDTDNQQHLSFGEGAQLLDACLAGPDREEVSIALDTLRRHGTAFQIKVRHDGGVVALRGCPVGRYATVFLQRERDGSKVEPDYRAVLEALPIPVWFRDKDLRISWANAAFLEMTGASTLDEAIKAGSPLDRLERDLALGARNATTPITAKRYAVVHGVRQALTLWSCPLRDRTVAGAASDFSAAADASGRASADADADVHALNSLPLAVAIFGPDRRLVFCNESYTRLWGFETDWLERKPTAGEILDRLRELRRLPEQSDFPAWKRDRLKLFDDTGHSSEELWHLPNGTTVRVTTRPRPAGGLLYMLEDITDRLRQESAYNALIKVQQATLNMLQEAVAVFGTDGRLRLHNAAFAQLWQLDEDDLEGSPHLNGIAQSCTARFGEQAIWEIISSSVTAASPRDLDGSIGVKRRDGRIVSLLLSRLPDGAVLVTFTDITDHARLESALREPPTVAA
jgi:PAS domain-containing protein